MSTHFETGHAKNVANFKTLIDKLNHFGTTYNPPKDTLKIPHLNTIVIKARAELANVIDKNSDFNVAIANRALAFKDLQPLSTRLVNTLKITDASPQRIDDAKGFIRKLQGKRASKIVEHTDPNTPAPKTISASQQSYDQQVQHFMGLIAVLRSEASYKPNENELKIEALVAKQNELTQKNDAVSVAHSSISNARNERNQTFYANNNGLVDIAMEVKDYVKAAYGAKSVQFKEISGIRFKKINP
jgi:hypothetical protein